LIPPNELVGQPARVVRIQFGSGGKAPKWLWLLLAIPMMLELVLESIGDDLQAELQEVHERRVEIEPLGIRFELHAVQRREVVRHRHRAALAQARLAG